MYYYHTINREILVRFNTFPPPTISTIGWFDDTGRKINPIPYQHEIVYVEGGRYLFMFSLTADQLMREYHCEVMITGRTEPEVASPYKIHTEWNTSITKWVLLSISSLEK